MTSVGDTQARVLALGEPPSFRHEIWTCELTEKHKHSVHQVGSTDPSYFPLTDLLEPAGYEGGEGLPGSGALGEQVPWGGRPGGGSNKLLGNDRQRLEFSLHQVQPDQFAKHCVWLVTILAEPVLQHCSSRLECCGTLPWWDWPCGHPGATSKERFVTAGESTSPACIAAVQHRIHLPGACLEALSGNAPSFPAPTVVADPINWRLLRRFFSLISFK